MYADPTDMNAIRELLHEILRNDPAPLHLGIDLGEIEQGKVTMSMTVSDFMANGHGICHGGYLFTPAAPPPPPGCPPSRTAAPPRAHRSSRATPRSRSRPPRTPARPSRPRPRAG